MITIDFVLFFCVIQAPRRGQLVISAQTSHEPNPHSNREDAARRDVTPGGFKASCGIEPPPRGGSIVTLCVREPLERRFSPSPYHHRR